MPGTTPDIIDSKDALSWIAILVATIAGMVSLAWLTGPADLAATAAIVGVSLVRGGAWTLLWLIASLGLGLAALRTLRVTESVSLALPTGLAVHLALTHALTSAGLMGDRLAATPGLVIAWLPIVVGFAAIAFELYRHRSTLRVLAPSPWAWLCVPSIAVLLTASLSPPGWLWASEFAGYDALSYHLALPRLWAEQGQLATLETNVYSALPSFLEASWTQLAILMGATPGEPGSTRSLVEAGDWAVASQLLHAGMALIGVWTIAAAAQKLCKQTGVPNALLAAFLLSVPWVVVTGSLAYNELGVVVLGAAACLAALVATDSWKRGLLSGLLLAAAVGCKPTAMFLVGPTVAVLLLISIPPKHWPTAIFAGCVAGLLTLAPWLIRNVVATGNPVFPFATGLFGTGHWTVEQAERWAIGHRFDGSFLDRIVSALWISPAAAADAPEVERFRGLLSPQWLAVWPLVFTAAIIAFRSSRTARLLTLAGAMGLFAWLMLTHVQSRFLVPLLIPGALLIALAASALRDGYRDLFRIILIIATLAQTGMLLHRFTSVERDGKAMLALISGQRLFLGIEPPPDPSLDSARALANRTLTANDRVLLIGDAAPYPWLPPTIATTTWDRSPLAEAADISYDPNDWIDVLARQGITHVAIDLSEIDRLRSVDRFDDALSDIVLQSFLEAVVDEGGSVRSLRTGELVTLPEQAP